MCNPLSLSPDEGVDARMYQEQLLMADLYLSLIHISEPTRPY